MNTKRKKIKKPKKPKRKLTVAQKRARREAKKERQKKHQWIFINGKQVRVKREPQIDGIPADEWIRQNADPIWLVQNEMWEYLDPDYFNDLASTPGFSEGAPGEDVDANCDSSKPTF
jgi:hypothetical protein